MAFDPISAGLEIAGKIIDRVWPDKTAQDEAKLEMLKLQIANEFQLQIAQAETNTEQAKSQSVFVAGARPFMMWVCGVALCYQYLIRTLVPWIFAVSGHPVPPMPSLDENLWELTAGMLGLAGWRSWDKKNGRA